MNPTSPRLILVALVFRLSTWVATGLAEDPIQVTTAGGSHPAVSPDGVTLAFVEPGGGVSLMSLTGGPTQGIAPNAFEPDWSPDGTKLLYRADDGLWVYDLGTSQASLLHDGSGWDDGPAWSPLGDEIAVQGSLKFISYPGGALTDLTCDDPDGSDCEGEGASWSPDGQWLAFEDGLEILKVARSGGLAQVVVEDLRDVTQPAWSPDGNWIAIAMNDPTGNYSHIWVADARGSSFALGQVTSGDFQDYRPAWSPDSATLYFQSNRSGSLQIWKVPFSAPTPARKRSLGGVKSLFR